MLFSRENRISIDEKDRRNMAITENELIAASESERPALQKIERVLQRADAAPKLVAPNGETIELPQSVFDVLRQVIYHMMRGRAIFIFPEQQELTTQEAADILNVSRPYLIKLLDEDKIPYTTVGSHRRIRLSDLMSYKRLRDAERERGLNEIARMSQEFGVYD